MSHKICAVVQQPDHNASAAAHSQLSPRSIEMATRSATARMEQRRAELNKLETTNPEFKKARSIVPRGTGRDKLWFRSGQYWGKAYTIGLILRYEGLPMLDDNPYFFDSLRDGSKQQLAWRAMQVADEEERLARKRPAMQ